MIQMDGAGPCPKSLRDSAVTRGPHRIPEFGIRTYLGLLAPNRAPDHLRQRRLRDAATGPFKCQIARMDGPELVAIWDEECIAKTTADFLVNPVLVVAQLAGFVSSKILPQAMRT